MNRVVAKDQIGQIELKNGKAKAFCGGGKSLEIYSRAENGKNVKSARRNVPKLTFSLIC